jgi:hypothetical protein
MLKWTVIGALVVLATGAALLVFRLPEARQPFPCVATAKTGWLTASTDSGLVVRVDWGGENRIGATRDGKLRWQPVNEAAARAEVQRLVTPLARTTRSDTAARVSVFVGCDGKGDYWHGEAEERTRLRDCLQPVDETRRECLKRYLSELKRVSPDEAAGAMSDGLDVTARRMGVVF